MATTASCPACAKSTVRDEELKKKLLNRLRRIEGQVRGIEAMIEDDAYCNDVLVQSAAVNAAINAFNKELLACHSRGSVAPLCYTSSNINREGQGPQSRILV